MKKTIISALLVAAVAWAGASAEKLTILHTNDTHSTIQPDAKTGLGGVLRRKALVDSVRGANPGMLLIDAGDAVQGSLYFSLFGGEVERRLMNALGYDIAILGNHEFDNGVERLAEQFSQLDAELLSSNYRFDGTPLEALFLPYSIRNVGDKRVAFIALNIDPAGLIIDTNSAGVVYRDAIAEANRLAHLLKTREHADRVVAITHIGYDSDSSGEGVNDLALARSSRDIDLIIGGHTHTLLTPGSAATRIPNAVGDTVTVVQAGSKGAYVGEVTLDLDNGDVDWQLLRVDSRLDDRIDPEWQVVIDRYSQGVDSVSSIKVGRSAREMAQSSNALANLTADMAKDLGDRLAGRPTDFAIMNTGGIRNSLPGGVVTRGDIMCIYPFDNRLTVVEMTGADLRALFDRLSAQGGNAVSREVEVVMDKKTGKASSITIAGKPLDDNRTYLVSTIDYLANGNDYMEEFTRSRVVARQTHPVWIDYVEWFGDASKGKRGVDSEDRARMHY